MNKRMKSVAVFLMGAVLLLGSSCGSPTVLNGTDGRDGADGKNGIDGKDGADGIDGVGVAGGYLDAYGHLILVLTDGNVIDAGAFTAETAAVTYSEGLYYQKVADGEGEALAVKSIGSAWDTEIVMPSVYRGLAVTEILSGAFSECGHIVSVYIPATVKAIGSDAFYGCGSLGSVIISDISAWCRLGFENTNANPLANGAELILNGTPVTELEINGTGISAYCFYGYGRLTGLTLGDGVSAIGEGAFMLCSGLSSIRYEGTREQWSELEKGDGWDYGTGNYTVYCSDGNIVKSA